MILLFIVLGGLFILLIVNWIIKRIVNVRYVKKLFNELCVCVVGNRGTGKDTLFSYMSYKIPHNSNIPLHDNTNIIALSDLMIPLLQRPLLVEGARFNVPFENYKQFENPTFISDAGIHFPNYEDSKLKKEYSNLAISIAIWRHLYNSGLHWNIQKLSRLWVILREQVDWIINTKAVVFGPLYAHLNLIVYEDVRDYELNRGELPKNKLIGREEGEIAVERANRGLVKNMVLYLPKWKIQHDPFYFRKIVFKEEEEHGTKKNEQKSENKLFKK